MTTITVQLAELILEFDSRFGDQVIEDIEIDACDAIDWISEFAPRARAALAAYKAQPQGAYRAELFPELGGKNRKTWFVVDSRDRTNSLYVGDHPAGERRAHAVAATFNAEGL